MLPRRRKGPRPASRLDRTIYARAGGLRVRPAPRSVCWHQMTWKRYALASIWLGVVLFLGSADFAAANTAPLILPLLKQLAPGASNAQLHATHMVLRKLAHLTEYALLWFWAIVAQMGRPVR